MILILKLTKGHNSVNNVGAVTKGYKSTNDEG